MERICSRNSGGVKPGLGGGGGGRGGKCGLDHKQEWIGRQSGSREWGYGDNIQIKAGLDLLLERSRYEIWVWGGGVGEGAGKPGLESDQEWNRR